MIRALAVFALLLAALATPSAASASAVGTERLEADSALRVSQAAIGRTVRDYTFVDSRGREVRTADLRGRPYLVNFVYTSCYETCPTMTESLGDAIREAHRVFGPNAFTVLTIGFDARVDTPQAMKYFADRHGKLTDNWLFLSGELPAIVGMAEDLGFVFYRSAAGYDHLNQITLVGGTGKVEGQIYGDSFPVNQLVEPLKWLVLGRSDAAGSLTDLIDRVRIVCTVYDPTTGFYKLDYTIFANMAGGLAVIIPVAWFLWRSHRPRRRQT